MSANTPVSLKMNYLLYLGNEIIFLMYNIKIHLNFSMFYITTYIHIIKFLNHFHYIHYSSLNLPDVSVNIELNPKYHSTSLAFIQLLKSDVRKQSCPDKEECINTWESIEHSRHGSILNPIKEFKSVINQSLTIWPICTVNMT